MRKLTEALQWSLDAVGVWLRCVISPTATLRQILTEATDETRFAATTKVLIPSLLIALLVSSPVFKLYGIEWDNIGYQLSSLTTTLVFNAVAVFFIHVILKKFHQSSEFFTTLIIFSAVVAAYTPLTNLLNIPTSVKILETLKEIKSQSMSLQEGLVFLFHSVNVDNSLLGIIRSILTSLAIIVSFLIITMFVEIMTQWYGNSKFESYAAVVVALFVSSITMFIVFAPIQFLTMYAYIKKD